MALAAWIASDNADTIAINRSLWDALTIARCHRTFSRRYAGTSLATARNAAVRRSSSTKSRSVR